MLENSSMSESVHTASAVHKELSLAWFVNMPRNQTAYEQLWEQKYQKQFQERRSNYEGEMHVHKS